MTAKTFDDMLPDDNSSALATLDEETSSLGFRSYSETPEFSREDIQLPRLRLAQGLTKEVQEGTARPGQFVLLGYEPESEVILVPLLYGKAREYRQDGELLCSSPDAKVGRPVAGSGVAGGSCLSCPLAEWQPRPDGKGNFKPCGQVFSYVCFSLTHDSPIVLEFRRTAERTAKTLNTIIQAKGLGHFAIKLTAKAETWGKGSGFTPSVELAPLDTTTLEALRALPLVA